MELPELVQNCERLSLSPIIARNMSPGEVNKCRSCEYGSERQQKTFTWHFFNAPVDKPRLTFSLPVDIEFQYSNLVLIALLQLSTHFTAIYKFAGEADE